MALGADVAAELFALLTDRRLHELKMELGRDDLVGSQRDIYVRAKTEAGYNATYFLQMLAEAGPLETARKLIMTAHPSQGFTALWERRRLDLTVEAHVLAPHFTPCSPKSNVRRLVRVSPPMAMPRGRTDEWTEGLP